ncbi:MAG: DNA gyrase subunit A [Alphaproteobacteria bacterium]|nr:DNA gyrase subunit A [Alphaproteobacteria bacterium]
MRRSYLDYAMSVIVSRAIPDVRDGLKPVHRRILYAMKEAGYDWNRPYRKSARVVGDVMGKYHPHGDAAIYDAMVRMAQDFSMRLMLLDGQGNFGSMDGDPPAAMRYTEIRLAESAHTMLEDIDKETVDFQPNYDDSSQEPVVLPACFPNLLVNGAGGIAVGMATNIPTHNLGEVIDAACAVIDNPDISVEELMEIVPAPDFPTGGTILGRTGVRSAYDTGRGSIIVRGRVAIEEIRKDREAIIITEIPYQVNKARMVERIAEMARDKQIDGIAELRDESDRHGVRVVVELRRDAQGEVVLNQLFRFTPLQTTFGVNMLALNEGRPELMGLRRVLESFLLFREEVITRRTIYELGKARERAHLLVGLAIAVANLDPVIALIRKAKDPIVAREQLMKQAWGVKGVEQVIKLIDEPGRAVKDGKYKLSEEQAKAILELRLQRLTGLERDKISEELKALVKQIGGYLDVLRSRDKLLKILRDELQEMKKRFATPRRTTLEEGEFEQDIEDLIPREEMVVTVSHNGYVKRVPLSTYRAQRRGGKGRAGMSTREEDFVTQVFVVNTHTSVLFFSSIGKVYKLKVYKLPLGSPQSLGKAMVNLLPLAEGETISTLMPLPEDEADVENLTVMFATAGGNVRRNRLSDFVHVMANGKIAMKLEKRDQLVSVRICKEDDDVLLSARSGKCIRFPVTGVRIFTGRASLGVRGIRLAKQDRVIDMSILRHTDVETAMREEYLRVASFRRRMAGETNGEGEASEPSDPDLHARMAKEEEFLLSVTENGYGKRSSAYEYRITARGGVGVTGIDTSKRNGQVVSTFPVMERDQILLVTDKGKLIRCPVDDIRIAGRATQGVRLFNVAKGEHVVSVTRLGEEEGAVAEDENPDAEEVLPSDAPEEAEEAGEA